MVYDCLHMYGRKCCVCVFLDVRWKWVVLFVYMESACLCRWPWYRWFVGWYHAPSLMAWMGDIELVRLNQSMQERNFFLPSCDQGWVVVRWNDRSYVCITVYVCCVGCCWWPWYRWFVGWYHVPFLIACVGVIETVTVGTVDAKEKKNVPSCDHVGLVVRWNERSYVCITVKVAIFVVSPLHTINKNWYVWCPPRCSGKIGWDRIMYMPLLVRSQWRIVYIDFLGVFSKAESVAYKDTRTNKTKWVLRRGYGVPGGWRFTVYPLDNAP